MEGEERHQKHQSSYDPHHPLGNSVVCTCGWKKTHARAKILVRAVQKHLLKTGHEFKKPE